MRKVHNKTECSIGDTQGLSTAKPDRSTSRSKKLSRPIPSFQLNYKGSPLASSEHLYPPSPRINEENTRFIMNKYLMDSNKAQNNEVSSSKKNTSNGVSSPCEFITWNESKYGSRSIDNHPELTYGKLKDEQRHQKLMRPVSRQRGIHSMNSCTSDTLNSGDDTHGVVKFKDYRRINNHSKNKKPRNAKSKNVLAYSLLDRSLDNTINLIENARKKELGNMKNCKYSLNLFSSNIIYSSRFWSSN